MTRREYGFQAIEELLTILAIQNKQHKDDPTHPAPPEDTEILDMIYDIVTVAIDDDLTEEEAINQLIFINLSDTPATTTLN